MQLNHQYNILSNITFKVYESLGDHGAFLVSSTGNAGRLNFAGLAMLNQQLEDLGLGSNMGLLYNTIPPVPVEDLEAGDVEGSGGASCAYRAAYRAIGAAAGHH